MALRRLGARSVGTTFWFQGSVLTNPADLTIVVDTGPMTAGNYLLSMLAAGSVAVVYDWQHRDASNTSTLHSQRRRWASGPIDDLFGNDIALASGERIRIILQGAIVGEFQGSIFAKEVEAVTP